MKRIIALMMCALCCVSLGLISCGETQPASPVQDVKGKSPSEQILDSDESLGYDWCALLCNLNTAFVSNEIDKLNELNSRLLEVEEKLGGTEAVVEIVGNCTCGRNDSFLEKYAMRMCELFEEADYEMVMIAVGFIAREFSPDEQTKIDNVMQDKCPG